MKQICGSLYLFKVGPVWWLVPGLLVPGAGTLLVPGWGLLLVGGLLVLDWGLLLGDGLLVPGWGLLLGGEAPPPVLISGREVGQNPHPLQASGVAGIWS